MRGARRVLGGLLFAASAMLALLAGCAENTSIMLVVEGDLRPGVDVDSLLIVVTGGDAERTVGPRVLTEVDGLPQSLLILPGEVVTERVEARVSASLGPSERIHVERTLAFEPNRQTVYRICLDRDCVGSEAPECLEGSCGDEADADADVDADTDSDTDSDSDADPDQPPCDPSTCDDGQYCNGPAVCDGNRCVQGPAPTLEDGIACTDDTCDEAGDRVVHTPNDSRCQDADECTVNTCVVALGCSVTPRDRDGDGYGDAACGGDDCDDEDAAINPDGVETCNGRDDNCDGAIDETSCPCTRAELDGQVYQFCGMDATWMVARDSCAASGYTLVTIDDAAEQAFVWTTASGILPADWWIGLNDLASENVFEWIDGTIAWEHGVARGYCNWAAGSPETSGASSDCVELDENSAGQWLDRSCTQTQAFVCELPVP